MVQAMKDKETIKDEARAASESFKLKLAEKDAKIEQLSSCITNGFQYVSKALKLVKNFESQKREYWLDDKIVLEEDLTAKDHQLELDMAESANKAEMERIEKEEAAKKTAELNALSTEGVTDVTDEQIQMFEDYTKQGDELHKAKNYDQAILQYKLALAIKPNDKAANNKVLKCQNWIDKLKAKNDIEVNH
jgi:tetratricopeptide (TPR) repeat protein